MIQLTALSQKISLLVVLSLLSTLLPGPTPLAGIGQAVKIDSPSFISPLPTPMPPPQAATFTSPLPTPLAPAPMLGLTVWAEPVGGAPGEIVTLTLRLDKPHRDGVERRHRPRDFARLAASASRPLRLGV